MVVRSPRLREHPVTLRLPADLIRRADELVPYLARDATMSVLSRASRSQVLRLALLEGLAVLEARFETAPGVNRQRRDGTGPA